MATALPTAEPSPPRPALEAALARLRLADDFPAVSGRVQQLMEVLGDEDASVQKLTNLIIQDYSMTVKLLKTANTFHFNRTGVPFVSVSHAIVLLGVQAIRELASSIVVFEHFQHRSPGLRQLLMLSLLSANHAREIAARTRGVRGEEAYLLGMLRNLGEVLVACYLPDEYAAVLRDMADARCPERVSCRRVLDFEYEELAGSVIRDWHLSSSSTLPGTRERERRDPTETVLAFAHGLTSAVYRQQSAPSHQGITLLLQKHASLGLNRDDVVAVLEAGVKGTRETFAQAGIRLDDLQLKHQMTAALIETPEWSTAGTSQESRSPNAVPPEDVSRSIMDVQRALENEQFDLNKMILIILEATLTAGGFNRAMLALVAGSRQEVCGRLGLGIKSDDLIAHFRFTVGMNGGPVGVALSRGQELIVARSWQLLPDEQRLLRSLNAGAIAILPLSVEGRTVGALYVDTVSPSQPADAALTTARHMRDAIVRAMRTRAPGAERSTSPRTD